MDWLSRNEYIRRGGEKAAKEFSEHVVRSSSDGRWLLHAPNKKHPGEWETLFWTEVVYLSNGRLLVHGDAPHAIFARYSPHPDADIGSASRGAVRWIGGRRRADSYVVEKAHSGMRTYEGVTICDLGVWIHDALVSSAESRPDGSLMINGVTIEPQGTLTEKLILQLTEDGIVRELIERAYDTGTIPEAHDWPSEAWDLGAEDWGMVPSWGIIYSHAALQRLVEIFDKETA
jgi:hypothetical protein